MSNRKILSVGQEITVTDKYNEINYFVIDGESQFRNYPKKFRAIVDEIYLEPNKETEEYLSDNYRHPKAINLSCFSINSNWQVSIKTKSGNYYYYSDNEISLVIDDSLSWEIHFDESANRFIDKLDF